MVGLARPLLFAVIACLVLQLRPGELAAAVEPGAAARLAPGVDLIPGSFVEGSQPDGNSVLLHGPEGLVVIDSGRHAAHTQAILDLARGAGQSIRVVLNTHWHLDHVGGNPLLRRAFPDLQVIASGALEDALTGFLASYRRQLEELVGEAGSPEAAKPFQDELAILDASPELLPDEVVTSSGQRRLAGRDVELHLETAAVTAADLWLLDGATRVLVAGDLVTLPAPFFDTACPVRWQEALGRLAAADFATLVPGHGAPMDRSAFDDYREAFDGLLACAASEGSDESCVEGWLAAAGELIPETDRRLARGLVAYYMHQSLRAAPETVAALCGEPRTEEAR